MQFGYLASLVVYGALMGTVFDLYNTVTGASRWLRWLRPTVDLVFWVVSALGVYYVVFITDEGRLRLYTFMLLLVGYLFYRLTFHQTIVSSAFAIVRWISGLIRLVYRILNTLVFNPVRVIVSFVKTLALRLYGLFCVLENGLFWILRFWFRIAVWPIARLGGADKVNRIFATYWEGFWAEASKWIKKKTTET